MFKSILKGARDMFEPHVEDLACRKSSLSQTAMYREF